MTAVATAPGKVMLAGEYAVLDGGLAVLVAVNRRARATLVASEVTLSPFLFAAREEVSRALGPAAAAAFDRIEVDSEALREGDRKLGIGSSAAATVAAVGLACGLVGRTDPEQVRRLAHDAHARAQGRRGAPGSGADVACSAHGGTIGFRAGAVNVLQVPADLRMSFAWTGAPADTTTLVTAVHAARSRNPTEVQAALADLAAAAERLALAVDPAGAIAALDHGAEAMDLLAAATRTALVPTAVTTLRTALRGLGGTAKTTGAGGGDIVLVATPNAVAPDDVRAAILAAGLRPLALAIDPRGVAFETAVR